MIPTRSRMRAVARACLLLAALALPVGRTHAQDARNAVIGAPTVNGYRIGTGAAERTITQTTMPIVLLLPISERFGMDVSTAFATSGVSVAGLTTSRISGLTDTQVRGNLSLRENLLVTFGLNLPTGQYLIGAGQQEAAGQIGNDFLNYAVSSMGNGLSMTGGVAYARPIGAWNLGLGSSVRRSAAFAAFAVEEAEYRFTPADELRLRLGVDRPLGEGQVALGLDFSSFGDDIADTTAVSTGDRLTASASLSFPVGGVNAFVSAWNLIRLEGEQVGGIAPPENVLNLSSGVSLEWAGILLQPTVETRLWSVDGTRAGNLFNLGLRARVGIGSLGVYPSVGISSGTLFDLTDGSETSLSGFRGSVTVRWN